LTEPHTSISQTFITRCDDSLYIQFTWKAVVYCKMVVCHC
jgi:hypothetical protein